MVPLTIVTVVVLVGVTVGLLISADVVMSSTLQAQPCACLLYTSSAGCCRDDRIFCCAGACDVNENIGLRRSGQNLQQSWGAAARKGYGVRSAQD